MKLLILPSTDPYLNLAVEEFLFLHTEEPVFMLWQNAPSVILGRNQNAHAEVDVAYAKAHGIRIARRITGGGAVYHDLGNINYSYITPSASGDTLDFASFARPILHALSALGVNATLSGRNDLEVDGKKISGSAQHRIGSRLLHHGTLLFDTDFEVLERVLRPNREKLTTRAIRSVGARVCNLGEVHLRAFTVNQFLEHLVNFLKETYHATPSESPQSPEVDALERRNASTDWIFPKKELLSRYTDRKARRYPFGTVEACLSMQNDVIEKIAITGDFFGTRPIGELEERLCDTPLWDLESRLQAFPLSDYIFGMRAEDLISLLRAV